MKIRGLLILLSSLGLLYLAGFSVAQGAPPEPAHILATEVIIYPNADTYVDSLRPDANYGTSSNLDVRWMAIRSTATRALLRFDLRRQVPASAVIDSARLELRLTSASGAASVNLTAWRVIANWAESTVTWNNQPAVGEPHASALVGTVLQTYTWEVGPIVQAWLAGDNDGLLLRGAESGADHSRSFASSDEPDMSPRLVVSYHLPPTSTPTATSTRTPTATPTAIPGQTLTLAAQIDAWADQLDPTANHGDDDTLIVGRGAGTFIPGYRVTLLRFDLATLPAHAGVIQAKMQLYQTGGAGPTSYVVGVQALTARWWEMLVDWGTLPPAVDAGVPPVSVSGHNGWKEWLVTDLVQSWTVGGRSNFGVLLHGEGSTETVRAFSSREGASPPRLVLHYVIDTTPPTNPTAFTSDHPLGAWSKEPTIDVQWSGASDGDGSGVYGYSYGWSTLPASPLPDEVLETLAESGTGHVADGPAWYFHIRTMDVAGNWSPAAAHYGPFMIDATPPTNPTSITFTKTPGIWYSGGVFSVGADWSGASDGGSGVLGYSYVWSTNPAQTPDTAVDTTGGHAYSGSLADGAWWFHIRTRDQVGNWSVAHHHGPFQVDRVAPTAQIVGPLHPSNKTFTLFWSGSDSGSGVASYDLRYEDVTAYPHGIHNWLSGVAQTSGSFAAYDGHTYRFQVRARDIAGNVRDWATVPWTEVRVESVDFQAVGLEITQAVQNLSNGVRLIQDKRTFARFYVRSQSGNHGPVDARLTAYRNGVPLGTVLPNNAGGTITVRHSPDRGVLEQSFYFDLPTQGVMGSWLQGTVHFVAQVNLNDWAESNYFNNTASADVTFVPTPAINIVLLDVFYMQGNTTHHVDVARYWELASWLKRIYPVPAITTVWAWMGPYAGVVNAEGSLLAPNCGQVDADLFWHLANNTLGLSLAPWRRYYGMVSDAGGFMRGCAGGIPSLVASGPSWAGNAWYGSHELGHAYAQPHTTGTSPAPCGDCNAKPCGPWGGCGCEGGGTPHYPNGDISPTHDMWNAGALYGFDIETRTIYPPTHKDIMTYCQPEWISDYTYMQIHDQIMLEYSLYPTVRAAAPQEHLAVFGTIVTPTDQVRLDAFWRLPSAGDAFGRVRGEYSVRLLDAGGAILADYPFTPRAASPDPGLSCSAGANDTPPALIAELVPWVANTARVAIVHDGRELAGRVVSSRAPAVTLRAPNGGEVLNGATIGVDWTASDADGDALTFTVNYSPDDGAHWQTVAAGLTTTGVQLEAAGIPGSTQGRFRVLATDGVNTASDDSDGPFSVPDKTPLVHVSSPAEGAMYRPGQTVALEGAAQDVEDGSLGNAALAWTSSLSGTLGTGHLLHVSDLITGTHILMLTATDSAGHAVVATRTVHICDCPQKGYLPLIRLSR